MIKVSDLKVIIDVQRVGSTFYIKNEGKVLATIDLQRAAGLIDEEAAMLVSRLDAKEKSSHANN